MTNIIEIVGEFAPHTVDVRVRRQLHLPQSGDSRPDKQMQSISRHRFYQLARDFLPPGARPDQPQVTFQNIPELGQLVDVATPQQRAHESDAGIIGSGPTRIRPTFTVVNHGAQPVNDKQHSVTAHSGLEIKGGTARGARINSPAFRTPPAAAACCRRPPMSTTSKATASRRTTGPAAAVPRSVSLLTTAAMSSPIFPAPTACKLAGSIPMALTRCSRASIPAARPPGT
jgi:hypothetical protein